MKTWSKFAADGGRPARIFLLTATVISVGLLVARNAGVLIPQPLLWVGWLIIDVKVLLKLAELAIFLRAKRAKNESVQKGRPIRLNPFLSLMLAEVTMARGFVESWKRRNLPVEGFTFRGGQEYESIKYVLWISVLVELPFLSFLFYNLRILVSHRAAIEGVMLAASAYALVAFRADRYAVKYSAHQLADDQLIIHMGLRVKGVVPLACIAAVAPVQMGKWRSFARKSTLDGMSVAKVSPLDKPNVVLRVACNSVELEWMHGNTTWPEYIGLYVDHPHHLLAKLRTSCASLDENHLRNGVALA